MRHIACGFTANVDATGHLNEALIDQIKQYCTEPHTSPVRPGSYLKSWDELLDAIIWNVQRGSGAEYIVTRQDILNELCGFAGWKWAVGGTGLQAASAAYTAGYGALVNFPAWSHDYDFLVAHDGLEVALKEHDFTPVHYILEYSSDSASNRIILRGLKEVRNQIIAPSFTEHIRNESHKYHWLLISGYNAVDDSEEMNDLLAETRQFLQSLGENCPPVHLELAAIFSNEAQLRIINELGPMVQSVGLNEDELGELFNLEQPLLELDDDRLIDILRKAHERFKIPNLIVHTHQFAACMTKGSSSGWKEALHNGGRFASARAAQGRYCTLSEIGQWESKLKQHPRGQRLAQLADSMENVIIVPALQAQVVCTIGLGDTFTAGLLLAAPIV